MDRAASFISPYPFRQVFEHYDMYSREVLQRRYCEIDFDTKENKEAVAREKERRLFPFGFFTGLF